MMAASGFLAWNGFARPRIAAMARPA